LDPIDLEVRAIVAKICQSDDADFGYLLEVMHPDFRLFYEPVTESNRRALSEFRERMAARRSELKFAVTSRHVYGEDMVAEVVMCCGNELPKVWYFLRSGGEGKLLLRATPDLPFGVAFRSFVLELPKELVEQQKMVIEMYSERERKMMDEGKAP
jgi:hypothetical protein